MKCRRTLLKALAILGPMAVALSSYATGPAYAYDDDWCSNYYNYYHDPRCAYLYDYPYPNGFFFFGDDRRFHHRFHDHDDPNHHDPRHDGPRHDPGRINHGGSGGVRSAPPGMFIPDAGGHRR
jgi:hypothetical protein